MRTGLLRSLATPALLAVMALLGGCAATAPSYQASNDNILALSAAPGQKLAIGTFDYGPKGSRLNSLTIRGGSYKSPVENSWAAYLRESLKTELIAAGRWQENSDIIVSATLLENELDGSQSSVSTAQVSARFMVERGGARVYDRVLKADSQWDSSFIGAVAIPIARNNYIATLSQLLGKLFADPEFQQATR